MFKENIMVQCKGRATFLTITSLVCIAIWLALLISGNIVIKTTSLSSIGGSLFVTLLVCTILTALLLGFTLYASLCGKVCAKIALSIFFIIFDAILLSIAVSVLSLRNSYMDDYEKIWDDAENSTSAFEEKEKLEQKYNCCGYDKSVSYLKDCGDLVVCESFLSSELTIFVAVLFAITMALFILMTVGIVMACVDAYHVKADEDHEEEPDPVEQRYIRPIAYGF